MLFILMISERKNIAVSIHSPTTCVKGQLYAWILRIKKSLCSVLLKSANIMNTLVEGEGKQKPYEEICTDLASLSPTSLAPEGGSRTSSQNIIYIKCTV
jgi:hypothetical protein